MFFHHKDLIFHVLMHSTTITRSVAVGGNPATAVGKRGKSVGIQCVAYCFALKNFQRASDVTSVRHFLTVTLNPYAFFSSDSDHSQVESLV